MDKKGIQRDFQGRWITTERFCGLRPVNVFHRQLDKIDIPSTAPQNSHILFRKRFEAEGGRPAYIYISADDYYKLYVNGRFVCCATWTNGAWWSGPPRIGAAMQPVWRRGKCARNCTM